MDGESEVKKNNLFLVFSKTVVVYYTNVKKTFSFDYYKKLHPDTTSWITVFSIKKYYLFNTFKFQVEDLGQNKNVVITHEKKCCEKKNEWRRVKTFFLGRKKTFSRISTLDWHISSLLLTLGTDSLS